MMRGIRGNNLSDGLKFGRDPLDTISNSRTKIAKRVQQCGGEFVTRRLGAAGEVDGLASLTLIHRIDDIRIHMHKPTDSPGCTQVSVMTIP
jgi:hypothetical protein